MSIWFALLAVPVLALVDQGVAYVTTIWACTHQSSVAVHAVHVPFLIAAIVGTAAAWRRWRVTAPNASETEMLARRHFVAGLATGSAALSALVIAIMWAVTWVLRACVS